MKKEILKSKYPIADQFILNAQEAFHKRFPNGYFNGRAMRQIGDPHIVLALGLIGDLNDCSNSIRDNDPMYFKFMIYSDGEFENPKNEMKTLTGCLYIKPDADSYYAMQRVKVPFRKATNSLDKLENNFNKFLDRLVTTVKENQDRIISVERIPKKYFDIN